MSNIAIQHETTKAPAGNSLVKHPESITCPSWKRITVAVIQAGQVKRYGDSIYEADICFEGGTRSTLKGFDLPFGTSLTEERVKEVAKIFVHPFSDDPESWTKLESIKCIEKGGTYSIWRVKIVSLYTD